MTWWQILGAVASAVVSALAVYYAAKAAGKANVKAKEIESVAAPYNSIVEHLEHTQNRLEERDKQYDEMRGLYDRAMVDQMIDRHFIRRCIQVWDPRVPLPNPTPMWVLEIFNQPPQYPQTPGTILE